MNKSTTHTNTEGLRPLRPDSRDGACIALTARAGTPRRSGAPTCQSNSSASFWIGFRPVLKFLTSAAHACLQAGYSSSLMLTCVGLLVTQWRTQREAVASKNEIWPKIYKFKCNNCDFRTFSSVPAIWRPMFVIYGSTPIDHRLKNKSTIVGFRPRNVWSGPWNLITFILFHFQLF